MNDCKGIIPIELKPCPFCGGNAKVKCVGKGTNKSELGVKAECKNCGASSIIYYPLPHASFETRKAQVVENWNRRMGEDKKC